MRVVVLVPAAAFALAGCVSRPADTQAYLHGLEVNADYRQGFADGCETANLSTAHAEQHRNNDEFQNNPDYRLGWVAGTEKCKPVTHMQPSAPSIRSYD